MNDSEHLGIVMGCFRFILEKAISMTNISPMQGEQEVADMVDADTILTVHEPEREDDGDDGTDSESNGGMTTEVEALPKSGSKSFLRFLKGRREKVLFV